MADTIENNATAIETGKPKPIFKFFNDPKADVTIKATGFYDAEGMLVVLLPGEATDADIEDWGKFVFEFVFSPVPYDRLVEYRKNALAQSDNGAAYIDESELRKELWANHLKDWNLTDAEGAKVELRHTPEETLAPESEELLYQLPPTLIDTIITLYERKMGILMR